MTHVTVIIPTFRRPDSLARALDSAREQVVPGADLTVMVVDNDIHASAREVCEARPDVIYLHEPRAGVSHARNTGLDANTSRHVFFLDDDMRAEPGCIATLLGALERWDAGVASAAVTASMPGDGELESEMRDFFSRRLDAPEGPTRKRLGAGGTLFDLDRCDMPSPAFDPDCNETGGEDDRLLGTLDERGTTLLWVPDAHTTEFVPAHRATLDYLWTRNFAFGQGPTQGAADSYADAPSVADLGRIAYWMAVGAAQAALRAPGWLADRLLASPRRARSHAMMAQALGKVFWWGGFKPRLYGEAGQARLSRATRTAD